MVFKSKESLIDYFAQTSQWRRRELISIKQSIQDSRSHEETLLCRVAVVFSYAHWEGFVKDAATAYVSYVAFKAPVVEKLTSNFQALLFRSQILSCQKTTRRIKPHLELLNDFLESLSRQAKIKTENSIDTESNLSAEVFENICLTIGVDYSSYWHIYEPRINELVKIRCAIAHGEQRVLERKYAVEILDFIQNSITHFRTDIENAIVSDAYLRS